MVNPCQLWNFVNDGFATGDCDGETADVVGDGQHGVAGIQQSITRVDAVADIIEGKASGRIGIMGVAHHDDHRIVLVDEGGAIQALAGGLGHAHGAGRNESGGVGPGLIVSGRVDVIDRSDAREGGLLRRRKLVAVENDPRGGIIGGFQFLESDIAHEVAGAESGGPSDIGVGII